MSFSLVRKHLNKMGSLRPRSSLERSYIPMAGPPRFPMSTAQRLILGVGSLGVMMIIPYWCLFNLRRWSRMHLGLPPEEEEKEEPPPPEAQEETDKEKDKKDKKEKDKKEDKKEEKKK